MDETPTDSRRRRLLFRATRRGTRENDLLLGGFIASRLAGFSEPEMDMLEAILDLPDPWLADWLTGRAPVPAEHDTPMLRAIMAAADAGPPAPAAQGLASR